MTPRHQLFVGWVLGTMHRHGIPGDVILTGDGIPTNRIAVPVPDVPVRLVVVVPAPPDGWKVP